LNREKNKNHNIKKRVVSFSHLFFILFFAFSLPLSSSAKFIFTPAITKSYADFLKLKVASAEKVIRVAHQEDSQNGIAIYVANYGDIIRLLVSEDQATYDLLLGNEEIRIDKLEDLETDSPYYLFTQAEIRLQWAFVKLKFGDEGSAFPEKKITKKLH
jgi:hypothetical protein